MNLNPKPYKSMKLSSRAAARMAAGKSLSLAAYFGRFSLGFMVLGFRVV